MLQVDNALQLLRMVKTGSGYLSQSELPVTFGLGKPDPGRKMRLTIVWPSGHKDTVENIQPNQAITVQQGKGIIAAHPIVFTRTKNLSVTTRATGSPVALLGSIPASIAGVPHISLVFRQMWDTVALPLTSAALTDLARRVPILRALCEGWDSNSHPSTSSNSRHNEKRTCSERSAGPVGELQISPLRFAPVEMTKGRVVMERSRDQEAGEL